MILPRLREFKPDILVISAGFDAHTRDPLANLNLVEADFTWVTKKLMEIADASAQGRIVSVLEGGYDLQGPVALGRGACHRADATVDFTRFLSRRQPAIDRQIGAGDEGRRIRQQINAKIGDLRRLAETAERNVARQFLPRRVGFARALARCRPPSAPRQRPGTRHCSAPAA